MTVRKRTSKDETAAPKPAAKKAAKKATKKTAKTKEPDKPANEFASFLSEVSSKKAPNLLMRSDKIPLANHLPTGAFALDMALLGGVPDGYNTMWYGYENSGKSTLLHKTIASAQRKYPEGQVVYVDTECLFDSQWASMNGVDLSRLHVARPETGNEAIDIVDAAMEPKECVAVILDSIPATIPRAVMEKSAEDKTMAELARLMGIMCSKVLTRWAQERRRDHYVTFLTVNQWRGKPGQMFGDPRSLSGGRQVNHLPSTKIDVKNKQTVGKDRYGNATPEFNTHTFKLDKTKHGSSFKEGEFVMNLNPDNERGLDVCEFDDFGTVLAFAKQMGLVTGGGSSWYCKYHSDKKYGRLSEIEDALMDDEDFYYSLRASLLAAQRMSKGIAMLPPDGYLERKGVYIPSDLKQLVGIE